MATVLQILPNRVVFNAGQFDSDFRYIRRTSEGVRSTMLAGPAVAVSLHSASWQVSWRFKCGNYNVVGDCDNGSPPGNVSNTPSTIAL
jgi:hypothetical protein